MGGSSACADFRISLLSRILGLLAQSILNRPVKLFSFVLTFPNPLPFCFTPITCLTHYLSITGCLSWNCRVEPKAGDRIPGMKYDTLMPKDIEPYLGGRAWKDLKVGDEIAFPEFDSAPTAESLVGLTFCYQPPSNEKKEGTFISFDANTGIHMVSMEGKTKKLPLRKLPDKAVRLQRKFTFEGSDAYFAADKMLGLGLCTIGELLKRI